VENADELEFQTRDRERQEHQYGVRGMFPWKIFLKISLKWSKRESIEVTMTTTMMMMIIMNAFV